MFTDSKTIIAGNFIEIFKYENEVWCGPLKQAPPKGGGRRMMNGKRSKESIQRAKGNLRRLINANAWNWLDENEKPYIPIFFTLTFAENMTDIKKANYEFTKFIQRFNYELNKENNLKYVSVIEFQKRGAVHYHFVFFNMPFVPDLKGKIERIWGQGFTTFRKLDKISNVGMYMSKYMSKEINARKLYGQKCYFTSRGLNKARVKNDGNVANFMLPFLLDTPKRYKLEYESNFAGKTTYYNFDLTDNPELKNTLLAFIK
ncbi:hypothetical protein EPO05_03335 [Patescibacteria group bacterium]|nr:MAG: hypothetical protein EPO05_03335 [Patescibacteria group bacterium]